MSYHGGSSSSSTSSSNNSQNTTSSQAQPLVAPAGFHYMPDGSLMADSAMVQTQAVTAAATVQQQVVQTIATAAQRLVAPTGFHYMPDGSLMADSAMVQPLNTLTGAVFQNPEGILKGEAPILIDTPGDAYVGEEKANFFKKNPTFVDLSVENEINFEQSGEFKQISKIIPEAVETIDVNELTGRSKLVAPVGFHYMPDGTLMADNNHFTVEDKTHDTPKVITGFDLDVSDLEWSGETRSFLVRGVNKSAFQIQIKNSSGSYYDFVSKLFQPKQTRFNGEIFNGTSKGSVVFPTVTGDDTYDVYVYALPGTKHAKHYEVRFGDGSVNANLSTGSNSLVMQKVVYQYEQLTLTLSSYSVTSAVTGTNVVAEIIVDRLKYKAKTPFSFAIRAAATSAYRKLKTPSVNDIVSFVSPVVGSNPITLPGENIYPAITTAANSASEGGTTVNGSSTGTTVTTHVVSSTIAALGDRVLGNAALAAKTVTVTAISGGSGKTFTISEAISIADDLPLTFSNQMNYSWPINKFVDVIQEGMVVVPGSNVTADTKVSRYEDSITVFQGTKQEQKIIKSKKPALDTLAKKPTVVKGLVTVQEGQVVFDKQQVLALAGTTLKVGGYGESNVLRLYGWEVKFTDLALTLEAPTTTTTEATSAHATIAVSDKEGVINNFSRVGGVGINPALQNPLITSGGGADGAGDWVMDAAQTLESGVTLTVENTGRLATITGNVEIIKAGTTAQTLRFDVDSLLSMSAPS